MIILLRNEQRHHTQRGNQEIWRSFASEETPGQFASGFGSLTAFDEFRIPPGDSTEPHCDNEAEMVTYVYRGALSQEDAIGNSGVIHTGEFQRMSAGLRIRRKESSVSRSDWVHMFRISLRPWQIGVGCEHEQKRFTEAQRRNVLCVVASADGRNGSLRIHQDVLVCSAILDPGHHLVHTLAPDRTAWLHAVCGEATINDIVLTQGDGVGVTNERSVSLTVQESTEFLLVDMGPTICPLGRTLCGTNMALDRGGN